MDHVNNTLTDILDTDPSSTQSSISGLPHPEANNILLKISPYLIISMCVLGIPGNLVIIIIMKRPPFHEMPHSVICLAIAVTDLCYLIYIMVGSVMDTIMGTDRFLIKFCQFYMAFTYLGFHLDSWLIVFLTYERAIAVAWPLKTAYLVTKKRIKTAIIVLVVFFLLWDSVYIFRDEVLKVDVGNITFEICEDMNHFGMPENLFKIYDEMTELFSSLIPLAFVIIGNIGIMYKLYTQRKVRAQLGQQGGNEMSKTNVMIITVTTTFVLTVGPSPIYRLVSGEEPNYTDPIFISFYILATVNPAINCYLYFMCGKSFRDQLLNIIHRLACVMCFEADQVDVLTDITVSGDGGNRQN